MEKTKEDQRTRPPRVGPHRDKMAVIHRRNVEDPKPYVPKIRVVGDVSVRELLGRDDEDNESVAPAHS